MHTGYNKTNCSSTLIGNWYEEDALQKLTGYTRRQPNDLLGAEYKTVDGVSPEDARNDREREDTHDRVIGESLYRNGYQQSTGTGEKSDKCDTHLIRSEVMGPRAVLRHKNMLSMAQKKVKEESDESLKRIETDLLSAKLKSYTQESYDMKEFGAYTSIKRIPRGRGGGLKHGDFLFTGKYTKCFPEATTLAEAEVLDREKLKYYSRASPLYSQSQNSDLHVTRYSHAIQTGIGLNYPATESNARNPFGKSSRFSNDIKDPTKYHGEATEPMSIHDESNGMTTSQRSAASKLETFLELNSVQSTLWIDYIESIFRREQKQYIDIAMFQKAMNNSGCSEVSACGSSITFPPLVAKEWTHIFMIFDRECIGAVSIKDVMSFFRSRVD